MTTPTPAGLDLEAAQAKPAHDSGSTIEAFFAEVRRLREVAEAAAAYFKAMDNPSRDDGPEGEHWALRQAVDRWQKGGE